MAHQELISNLEEVSGIFFEIAGSESNDLSEYMKDLDDIEDSIVLAMEMCDGCSLLVVFTGAGCRDMVFSYQGPEMGFDSTIRDLLAKPPQRFNVSVKAGDLGDYPDIVNQLKG